MRKLLLIVFLIMFIGFLPVKFTKKDINENTNLSKYIVCTRVWVTGYNWCRILKYEGDSLSKSINNDQLTDVEYFNFVNDEPGIKFKFGVHDTNVYIVYGKKLDEPMQNKFYENMSYVCGKWDIMYPVKRDGIFKTLLPKGYICLFDFIDIP